MVVVADGDACGIHGGGVYGASAPHERGSAGSGDAVGRPASSSHRRLRVAPRARQLDRLPTASYRQAVVALGVKPLNLA